MICKIITWLFLLSSIPCVYLIIQTHFSTKSAYKAHGTVVDRTASKSKKGKITYSLLIAYRDRNGIMQRMTSNWSSKSPKKDIGDTFIVLDYDDGSKPQLFLFSSLFLPYLFWLFVNIYLTGFFVGNDLLEWFYE